MSQAIQMIATGLPTERAWSELGVGLRSSRVDGEHDPGHMWLYWTEVRSKRPPFRGFRPDLDQVPEEFRPEHSWREFFFTNAVPGIRYVDYYAARLRDSHDRKCFDKRWRVDAQQKARLDLRCWIPDEVDSMRDVFDGRAWFYSWDTTRENWNNCASWAIKVANHTMQRDFLALPAPARLKRVIEVIDWDSKPLKSS